MKKLIFSLLLLCVYGFSIAQQYNNEWIDYSKSYHKFFVGTNGLYRIPFSTLSAAGLGSVPSEQFQLWRNGQEVALYVTKSTGTLGATDYIEFYGMMNDGLADTKLYKQDSIQMNTYKSLYTDTAAYFLTINDAVNKRFKSVTNDVASNTLPITPYFMYTLEKSFKNRMNLGNGVFLGQMLYAAAYETAEGWSSNPLSSGGGLTDNNSSIQLYNTAETISLKATVAGNYENTRNVNVRINNVVVGTTNVSKYEIKRIDVNNIPLSIISGDAARLNFSHDGISDQVVVSDYKLTYPRKFSFGAQSQFYFEMPVSDSKYIQISNFNFIQGAPVLYDLNNNLRLVGDVSGTLVRFVLPPVTNTRKMVLLSTATSVVKNISLLTARQFVDYSLPANQGNYLLVAHPNIYDLNDPNDPLQQYRDYRKSLFGGSFNATIIDINQLIDQFAFGIKHHPLSIRNFSFFAQDMFYVKPKYIFLVGKGLKYTDFRSKESDPNINLQALVPTFGSPASDNLLTADREGNVALLPIGRLSVTTKQEIAIYLEKVRQYELAQVSTDQTLSGKGWMKNIANLTGGLDDINLEQQINSFMDGYDAIAKDSLFGANVYNFKQNSGTNTAVEANKSLDQLFEEGLSVINYFGHASSNFIEFNLDNPESYNNAGKYPLMIVNGCNSGDLFEFDTLRTTSKGSLSEKFVLANNKGSIGYIATTHLGLPKQLNIFNSAFYKNYCKDMYGQPLGRIMQSSMSSLNRLYPDDYYLQAHLEEITLHGDPALKINTHPKPDFIIVDSLVTIDPFPVSVAENLINVKVKILNIGRGIKDSITVKIQRKLPDGSLLQIENHKMKAVNYEDSFVVGIPLNPIVDKGLNEIVVTIDPENKINELSKDNNSISKVFEIIEDEIRPVYPYKYGIVNEPNFTLYASTANSLAAEKSYVMELDTTALFNSSSKIFLEVVDSGGVIEFHPFMIPQDSMVYYWRVAVGPVTAATKWNSSSFQYIFNGAQGFSQSHYYQFKEDDFNNLTLPADARALEFENKTRKLLLRTGLYPYYDWDQININVDNQQLDQYGCIYRSLQIAVYDSLTLTPWTNFNMGSSGAYGSWPVCGDSTRNFFEFPYYDSTYRRKAASFLQQIPNGMYVSITNLGNANSSDYFIDTWQKDSVYGGIENSLWHAFHHLGLHKVDSFTRNIPFLFLFKKGDSLNFSPKQILGTTADSYISESFFIKGKQVEGSITTPWIGPVYNWEKFKWNNGVNNESTERRFDIIGKDYDGNEQFITSVYNDNDTSLSFIDAFDFPYLKMRMYSKDVVNSKAYQLKNWMLTTYNVPEGAIAPNYYYQLADTLMAADTLKLRVAFYNVSPVEFDSLKVRLAITNKDGVVSEFLNRPDGSRYDPLQPYDTVIIQFDVPMQSFVGFNQLRLEVNPDNNQPEWLHFNNFLYKQFYVKYPPLCPGASSVVSTDYLQGAASFQWQADNGSGYNDITYNNEMYTGVNAASLSINHPPTFLYGTKYRCRITTADAIRYSPEYVLTFAVQWKNLVDNAWENPNNWNCNTLPDEYTDVIISNGATAYPEVNAGANAVCRKLYLRPGTTVQINAGGLLEIKGPSDN